jgi:hypothetical protein
MRESVAGPARQVDHLPGFEPGADSQVFRTDHGAFMTPPAPSAKVHSPQRTTQEPAMTPATHAVARQSSNTACPSLPRQPRVGAAIASAIVSCALFASVVAGMSATGAASALTVAQSPLSTRT